MQQYTYEYADNLPNDESNIACVIKTVFIARFDRLSIIKNANIHKVIV